MKYIFILIINLHISVINNIFYFSLIEKTAVKFFYFYFVKVLLVILSNVINNLTQYTNIDVWYIICIYILHFTTAQ